ncbi:MAG TPA: EF-hand domain-containing protein [Devosiaceae bacterium]|jgi:hypothetical protein
MKKLLLLAAVSATLLSGTAFGQAGPQADFKKLDLNGDGNLSINEAQTAVPELTLKMYISADGNNDGRLDPDEFVFAQRAYEQAKAEGRIK